MYIITDKLAPSGYEVAAQHQGKANLMSQQLKVAPSPQNFFFLHERTFV